MQIHSPKGFMLFPKSSLSGYLSIYLSILIIISLRDDADVIFLIIKPTNSHDKLNWLKLGNLNVHDKEKFIRIREFKLLF